MPSYLGPYEGAAGNRIEKFKRAVRSFIDQRMADTQLIIISDGCQLTIDTYETMTSLEERQELMERNQGIYLLYVEKQPPFSGLPRNQGIDFASGDVICYLDTDDMLMPGHLRAIADGFDRDRDPAGYRRWVYFDDFIAGPDLQPVHTRTTNLNYGGIGTSSIAHEKSLNMRWEDNYGHDWLFVRQLMLICPAHKKIVGPRYLVCHLNPNIDF